MKKSLFSLFLCLLSVGMYASDVIYTSGQAVDAKIITVSARQISYNKVSMPDGPIFYMDLSAVDSIRYSNGETEVYHAAQSSAALGTITETEDDLYVLGNTKMTKAEYLAYLESHCPTAYNQYRVNNNMVIAGKTLLSVGIGCEAAAVCCFIANLAEHAKSENAPYEPAPRRATSTSSVYSSYSMSPTLKAAIALSVVGAACEVACIPLWVVGGVRRSHVLDTYNTECAGKSDTPVAVNLKVNTNGLGLAFRF